MDKAKRLQAYAQQLYGGEPTPMAAPGVVATPAQRAAALVQATEEEEEEEEEGDEEMIEGVIRILRTITDLDNRRTSAEASLVDFIAEGVTVDREAFLGAVLA